MDLNGFKRVNDVYGHGVGDEVLTVVAQRLSSAMREGDMVARFGGGEFAILAHHVAGPEAATNVAIRVIEALESLIDAGDTFHCAGAEIGIAMVPFDAGSSKDAMRKADIALYRAKTERRSALRFFEPQMDAMVRECSALEQTLRAAIDAGVIEPVFQPTIRLDTQDLIGFEMSPRWIDDDGNPVPTERFIAIAEEIGLIHRLAEDVLRKACLAARQWPAGTTLSTDIYPSQLRDTLLPARVADPEHARATLGVLRGSGVRITLDNFGTGYSSLYHLRNFKLDTIKIDRSFIQAMATDPQSVSIVNALAGLGRGLGLTVAAEGLDDSAQQAMLCESGCTIVQGSLSQDRLNARSARLLSQSRPETRQIG